VVAKYVTCLITLIGPFRITGGSWSKRTDTAYQFSAGFGNVVYPEIGYDAGYLDFARADDSSVPLFLSIRVFAAGMKAKDLVLILNPDGFSRGLAVVNPLGGVGVAQ